MLGLQQSALVYATSHTHSEVTKPRQASDPLALFRACDRGDFLLAHALLKADPTIDVNALHPVKGTTALMAAAKDRIGAETVRILLDFGADVHIANTQTRCTALHFAARSSDTLATELLLAAGADVYAMNSDRLMAVDVARRCGRAEAAKALSAVMKIHSGWLRVGDSEGPSKRWWGVQMACDANGSSMELCLFRSPTNTSPSAVVLLDSAPAVVVEESTARDCWSFRLDRPAIYQNLKHHRYTRDGSSGKSLSQGHVKICELTFAVDTCKERDAWIASLRCQHEGSSGWSPLGGPTSRQSLHSASPMPSERHPWPSDADDDQHKCVICTAAPRNAICTPCGHLTACYPCLRAATAKSPKQCPICRARVHAIVRVYTS